MTNRSFALKGNLVWSKTPQEFTVREHGFLVCDHGISAGVFDELPEQYADLPVIDEGDRLIIPGLIDLHLHAPQYTFRSIGMDLELLEWLETYAFPEESKYHDLDYARKAYTIFADELKHSATTRACMFGTLHVPATLFLMEALEQTGLITKVGKVNMDRNSPYFLQEESAQASAEATKRWIEEAQARFRRTTPILTPRFTPSCSDELMASLGELQKAYHLPVHSHLSENFGEIAWVQALCPNTRFYGEAYDQFGMFGAEDAPAIMAHCVHSTDEEIALMKQRGVFVAHCAESNANLSSGIAPVRKYLNEGLNVGLGCDIAGGTVLSIFRAMSMAIQCSKLRWRLIDDTLAPLSVPEAFYLGTAGGGAFFGKVGKFDPGYEVDALVLDETTLPHPQELSVAQRLERIIYLSDDRILKSKYVAGEKIF